MSDYFQGFNYSLANEDNFLEIEIANLLKPKNILAVAGSGNRSLFISSTGPDNLVIVDASQNQLDYCQYKEELIKIHNLEKYWQVLLNGPLLQGKYEQTLIKFSKIIQAIVGKKNIITLFSFQRVSEQWEYYQESFPKSRFRLALKLIGNPLVMNLLLYKGTFVKKNINMTHGEYYIERFEQIICKQLLQENFFAQLIFLGGLVYPAARICENTPSVYEQTKKWLEYRQPRYICAPISEIKRHDLEEAIDFVSYSNIPSYYQGRNEVNYMQELKKILSRGAIIILRFYLKEPRTTDFTGYQDVSAKYQTVIEQEKVNMYTIKIYQYIN